MNNKNQDAINPNMVGEVKQIFTSYWLYFAIRTACKLGVFDALYLKPMQLKDLSLDLELPYYNRFEQKSALEHLLDALCQHEFLYKNKEAFFLLTDKGKLLTQAHPQGLKNACMLWGDEHLTAWQHLEFTIKTDKPAFEELFEKPFFDYLAEKPLQKLNYHKAMYEYARDDYANLAALFNFSNHQAIMDVGGGMGALLEAMHKSGITSKLYLFDLPEVLNLLAPKAHSFQTITGDFFKFVPQVADAIILSRVLHDWNDWKVAIILDKVYEALPNDGKVYILENLSDEIPEGLSLLSLNMMLMCNSYERTKGEYLNLLKESGFEFESALKINTLQTLLVARKP